MACKYDKDLLYKKYKYYGFAEDVTTLGLMKPVYDNKTGMIKNKFQYFNHCKFEEFYLIRFHSDFLYKLKDTMIYFGKDRKKLENNLFTLCYHLYIGHSNYNYYDLNKIIDEYCSMYDDFQKINFILRLPELTIYQDIVCKEPITDIRLSESEYKLLEKFLLKHLNLENITKIEHYPKRGFLRRI